MLRRLWITSMLTIGALALLTWGYIGPPIYRNIDSVGDSGERVIALSFDDGPNPPYTDELLAVLAAERVHATFFMTGQHVAAHPDAARRVIAAGHRVGNHGWDQRRLATMSPESVRRSLARTDAVLREVGVRGRIDVRAPGLAVGYPGALVLRQTGRRHIGGRASGSDWTREPAEPTPPCSRWLPDGMCPTQDPSLIVERVLAGIRPGAIVVLHDGLGGLAGANRSGTIEAVRRIIPALRERGYEIRAIQEILDASAFDPAPLTEPEPSR